MRRQGGKGPRGSSRPQRPRRRRRPLLAVLLPAAAVVVAAGFWWPKPKPEPVPPPATAASASRPATAPDFGKLTGRWLRPDGGYVIEVRSVDDGGRMDASYLNPQPIHVARAEASQEDAALKVVLELRDRNYPGSTYVLTYDPAQDRLWGLYYHAGLRQNFDVVFVRMPRDGAGIEYRAWLRKVEPVTRRPGVRISALAMDTANSLDQPWADQFYAVEVALADEVPDRFRERLQDPGSMPEAGRAGTRLAWSPPRPLSGVHNTEGSAETRDERDHRQDSPARVRVVCTPSCSHLEHGKDRPQSARDGAPQRWRGDGGTMRPIAIVAFLVLLAAAVTGGASALAASAEEEHASGPVLLAAAPLTMMASEVREQPAALDAGPLLVAAAPPASIADSAPAPITVTSMPAAADPAPPCPPGAAGARPLVAIYAWLPAISATIGVDDIEASAHASISDVLHHFKGGGAAHYESGGRTNVVLDVLYAKLEGTKSTPDTSIDWTVKQWLVEGAVTLGRTGSATQFGEGLIGGRYFSLSNDISLSPQAVSASDSKAWAEPFVGGRYGTVLSPKWALLLTGDVGGFGVGSHLTWEAVAAFSYHLSPTTDLGLGYRYMHIDYDKNNFEFVGSMSGPLIGVAWLL